MGTEEKKKERPLILEIEDAKTEILNTVSKAVSARGIPCYLLTDFIESVAKQIRAGADNELAALRSQEAKEKNQKQGDNDAVH